MDRRYSEFQFLNNNLKKFYPGIILPPLCKNKVLESKTDPKVMKKRIN